MTRSTGLTMCPLCGTLWPCTGKHVYRQRSTSGKHVAFAVYIPIFVADQVTNHVPQPLRCRSRRRHATTIHAHQHDQTDIRTQQPASFRNSPRQALITPQEAGAVPLRVVRPSRARRNRVNPQHPDTTQENDPLLQKRDILQIMQLMTNVPRITQVFQDSNVLPNDVALQERREQKKASIYFSKIRAWITRCVEEPSSSDGAKQVVLVLTLKSMAKFVGQSSTHKDYAQGILASTDLFTQWKRAASPLLPGFSVVSFTDMLHSLASLEIVPDKIFRNELLKNLAHHVQYFDSVGLGSALHSLAKLRVDPGQVYWDNWETRLVSFDAKEINSQTLCNVFWAYGTLENRFPPSYLLDVTIKRLDASLSAGSHMFTAPELAIIMWALGNLWDVANHDAAKANMLSSIATKGVDYTVVGAAIPAQEPPLSTSAGFRVQATLLAEKLMAVSSQKLNVSSDTQSKPNSALSVASGKEISMMFWGLAKMHASPSLRFMHVWTDRFESVLSDAGDGNSVFRNFSSQQLSNSIYSFACLGLQPSKRLMWLWSESFLKQSHDMTPQALSNCAWALVTLDPFHNKAWKVAEFDKAKFRHEEIVNRIMKEFMKSSDKANTQESAMVLWAVSRLFQHSSASGLLPHEKLSKFVVNWLESFLRKKAVVYNAAELSIILHSAARLSISRHVEPRLFRAFSQSWLKSWLLKSGQADSHAVCCALWAMVKLDLFSQKAFIKASKALLPEIRMYASADPTISPHAISSLLWSIARVFKSDQLISDRTCSQIAVCFLESIPTVAIMIEKDLLDQHQLSRCLWAIGKLSSLAQRNRQALERLQIVVADKMSRTDFVFDPYTYAITTWHLGRLGSAAVLDNEQLRSVWMADKFSHIAERVKLKELCMTIWGFAKMEVPYSRDFAQLFCISLRSALQKKDDLNLQSLRYLLFWTKLYFLPQRISLDFTAQTSTTTRDNTSLDPQVVQDQKDALEILLRKIDQSYDQL